MPDHSKLNPQYFKLAEKNISLHTMCSISRSTLRTIGTSITVCADLKRSYATFKMIENGHNGLALIY